MSDQLQGKKIAILVANEGVEVDLLAPDEAEIQAFNHLDKGDTFTPDRLVGDAEPGGYDGLVLPGGVANPDQLRADTDAVQFDGQSPDDLDAFNAKIVEEFAEGVHQGQREATSAGA